MAGMNETLAALAALAATGQRVEASANRPLRLDGRDGCWIVEEGSVDVFYAKCEGGRQEGRRMRLCTVGPGGALFGMGARADAGPDRVMLVAAGTLGAKLSRLDQDRLAAWSAREKDALAAGLARAWIAALLGGIRGSAVHPRESVLAEETAGQSLRGSTAEGPLAEGMAGQATTGQALTAGKAVSTRRDMVFCRVVRGEALLLGARKLPVVVAGEAFPLTPEFWIEPGEELTFFLADDALALLPECHALVLKTLAALLELETEEEARRLSVKMERTARSVDHGLRSFLFQAEERAAAPPGGAGDPLFAACGMVGEAMGLAMVRPPAPHGGRALRYPLVEVARASRVRIRPVLLRERWWRQNSGPLLAFEGESRRPVALVQDTPVSYRLTDPETGRSVPVDEAVASQLAPMAFMFYRPFPAKPLGLWGLLAFGARGAGRDCLRILAMGLAGGLLTLAFPLLTAVVFDSVIPMAQSSQLLQIGGALLVGAAAAALFELTRAVGVLRLEGSMNANIQAAVLDRLLALPAGIFRSYPVGDMANRALGVNAMAEALTGSVVGALLSGVFSIFNVAILFSHDARLGLAAVCMTTLAAAGTAGFIALGMRCQKAFIELSGTLSGQVFQFVSGVAKLKVAGAESRAFARWMGGYREQTEQKYRSSLAAARLGAFNALYPALFTMGVFALVASQAQPLKLGEFLSFSAAFGQLLAAGVQISSSLVSLLPVIPIYGRARPIFETLPEVDPARSDPGELSGNIEVRGLNFRYAKDGPLVLRDVSFTAARGEFVAVVGPSGCGKSTLLRLLLGFEIPESGSIYYDNQNLSGIDVQSVRSQIGVVLQNGQIMSGDFYRNIIGSHNLTVDDAWEAARKAGLAADIEVMPMGMFTSIPSGGSVLSGGQRQRLLIARAMATKPRVFFFDEATSALDNITQAVVGKSLEEFKATRLVIAHRLSTIMGADKILVMDGGRIVEQGTYAQLMEAGGLFSALARRQLI